MDQDSFRKLLYSAEGGKKVVLESSQPAFQPRKVKKKAKQSEYRDRASERRAGLNEYAKVESVLEEFQQRTADLEDRAAVEEQRRYLGGDKDHTILVKGLDLALLKQNKARASVSQEDDSLEAAYQEAQPESTIPKKRTREDLVRELKEKRAAGGGALPLSSETDNALEKAKKIGKFKPIGMPDNLNKEEPIKKPKSKGKDKDKDVKVEKGKKRRKVHSSPAITGNHPNESEQTQQSISSPQGPSTLAAYSTEDTQTHSGGKQVNSHVPEEESADVDIFADVEEYQGIDFGEEDDDEHNMATPPPVENALDCLPLPGGNIPAKSWFAEEKDTVEKERTQHPGPSHARSPTPPPTPEPHKDPATEQPARLAPLASSALPSIGDFLAIDAQVDAQKKRRAKKAKQGEKKGKVSTEAKLDRDYTKLNSYMGRKRET